MSTKTLESLELVIAQKHLRDYSVDAMNGHHQAERPSACQRLLQGIEAFKWIVRAEETIRQAAYDGLLDYSKEVDDALEALYRGWLAPCEQIEALARQEIVQDGELDCAREFAACRDNARDWIERHEWAKASQRSRQRRFESEPW
jgi:hypothetical protein